MAYLEILRKYGIVVLQQESQMFELGGHGDSVGHEVLLHSPHEAAEADVSTGFILHHNQDRRGEIAHALAVRNLMVGRK